MLWHLLFKFHVIHIDNSFLCPRYGFVYFSEEVNIKSIIEVSGIGV